MYGSKSSPVTGCGPGRVRLAPERDTVAVWAANRSSARRSSLVNRRVVVSSSRLSTTVTRWSPAHRTVTSMPNWSAPRLRSEMWLPDMAESSCQPVGRPDGCPAPSVNRPR
jgi:hypothetical protein